MKKSIFWLFWQFKLPRMLVWKHNIKSWDIHCCELINLLKASSFKIFYSSLIKFYNFRKLDKYCRIIEKIYKWFFCLRVFNRTRNKPPKSSHLPATWNIVNVAKLIWFKKEKKNNLLLIWPLIVISLFTRSLWNYKKP